ncbi:MAG: GNAT family N-acetyltransferase [Rhizobiaceae bacterium]
MTRTPALPQVHAIDASFTQWRELLSLILRSFDYMNAIIDPPSSALRLNVPALQEKAKHETGLVIFQHARPVACMFCDTRPQALYVGKLAVEPGLQGKGLGSVLLGEAERIALASGRTRLELQTRIELAGNHEFFARHGFSRVGEGAHEGYSRPTWIWMAKELSA